MTDDETSPRFLIGAVLNELAADADAVLLIAQALEGHATQLGSGAEPQKLREMAALVKSAALALGMAAANVVGVSERLMIVAAFAHVDESGGGVLVS
jgi:hypothetical protein